jgi:glycine cleavage system H protein
MKINDYEILEDRLYTKEHEWIKLDGEYAIIGITDYAAKLLNDIVYVEMPEIKKELKAGESFGSVESVKTASEVYLPVSGRVVEINNELNESPEIINNSPYEKGWIIKIKPSDYEKEKLELLDMNKYGKIISNNK